MRKLTEPVTLGGVPFPYWAPCPEPGEPILLQDTPAQIREAIAAAAEERDHATPARPPVRRPVAVLMFKGYD